MTPKPKPARKPGGAVARFEQPKPGRGGWTPWIYPKPDKYLMQCCDCGLIHEMQFAAFEEGKRAADGTFEVKHRPAIRAMFRVRRALWNARGGKR